MVRKRLLNKIRNFNKKFIVSMGICCTLFFNSVMIRVFFHAIIEGANPFLMIFFAMISAVQLVYFIVKGANELVRE